MKMTRKMAYIGSFCFIGLFLASFLSYAVNLAIALFAAILAAFVLAMYKERYKVAVVCTLSAAVALMNYGAYDRFVYQNVIKYDGYDVEMKGIITGYADHSGDKSSYTVRGVINGDVRTTVTCYTDSISAGVGDHVDIIGRAEKFTDSYSFSANSYYKAKGIYLQITDVKHISCSESDGFSLIKAFDSYRERIIGVINSELGDREQAVMEAMLFGDKSDLASRDRTLMYRAGIGHIMAVSGVHLSVVCTIMWKILARMPLNKYVRFGMLHVPIFCFVLLAGMSNSVLRAAVMVIMVHGAELFRRRADAFNSLGIAVVLLTAFSPFTIRDPSFLLSVAGIFGAAVAAPAVIEAMEKKFTLGQFAKDLIVPLCVNAVIFPVAIMFFDEFSIISPVSNLVLLPLCQAILIGGIIVTVTGGTGFIAIPVLRICGVLCGFVIGISEFLGGMNFLYIPLGNDIVKAAAVILPILAAAAFAIFRRSDIAVGTVTVLFLLSVISVNVYRAVPDDNITVAVLRNGSGVCAVVHDKNSAGVIDLDGGGKTAPIAVKYLNRNGISQIDALVVNSGANTALPVYSEYFRLFDITQTFIPEQFSFFAERSAGEGESVLTYKAASGIELPQYTVSFGNSGRVLISCNGAEIIFYPDELVPAEGAEYSAAVRYSGTEAVSDPDTEILAVMNVNADAVSGRGQTVYIGENVLFRIDSKGTLSSEILE